MSFNDFLVFVSTPGNAEFSSVLLAVLYGIFLHRVATRAMEWDRIRNQIHFHENLFSSILVIRLLYKFQSQVGGCQILPPLELRMETKKFDPGTTLIEFGESKILNTHGPAFFPVIFCTGLVLSTIVYYVVDAYTILFHRNQRLRTTLSRVRTLAGTLDITHGRHAKHCEAIENLSTKKSVLTPHCSHRSHNRHFHILHSSQTNFTMFKSLVALTLVASAAAFAPAASFRSNTALFGNAEKVTELIVEQLGCDQDKVVPDASFIDDLGADSLDTVELIMAIEEEFDCEIPEEEATKITKVSEVIDYIDGL